MANKINGKNLSFLVDGEQFSAVGTSVVMDSEDAEDDATTFDDLAGGTPQQWFFQITALSEYDAGGFWQMLWDNAGAEDVAFTFNPLGTGVGKPSFAGTCEVLKKPAVGGQAGSTWTYEARLNIDGVPVKTTQS